VLLGMAMVFFSYNSAYMRDNQAPWPLFIASCFFWFFSTLGTFIAIVATARDFAKRDIEDVRELLFSLEDILKRCDWKK
jgi:hypothetical protein